MHFFRLSCLILYLAVCPRPCVILCQVCHFVSSNCYPIACPNRANKSSYTNLVLHSADAINKTKQIHTFRPPYCPHLFFLCRNTMHVCVTTAAHRIPLHRPLCQINSTLYINFPLIRIPMRICTLFFENDQTRQIPPLSPASPRPNLCVCVEIHPFQCWQCSMRLYATNIYMLAPLSGHVLCSQTTAGHITSTFLFFVCNCSTEPSTHFFSHIIICPLSILSKSRDRLQFIKCYNYSALPPFPSLFKFSNQVYTWLGHVQFPMHSIHKYLRLHSIRPSQVGLNPFFLKKSEYTLKPQHCRPIWRPQHTIYSLIPPPVSRSHLLSVSSFLIHPLLQFSRLTLSLLTLIRTCFRIYRLRIRTFPSCLRLILLLTSCLSSLVSRPKVSSLLVLVPSLLPSSCLIPWAFVPLIVSKASWDKEKSEKPTGSEFVICYFISFEFSSSSTISSITD